MNYGVQPSRHPAFHRNHIVRLAVGHQCRHALRMNGINMTVGIENQFPAVAMALPLRDYFDINAKLNRAHDEHPSKTSMCVMRKTQTFTCGCDCFARAFDRKYLINAGCSPRMASL